MNLILSADPAWGIGRCGALLNREPGDMAFFREMTTGKAVIMGRKTLESLPGGKPLPQRDNIVLTQNPNFVCEGVCICHSLPELFRRLAGYPNGGIMVIGGAQVYRLLLPYCDRAYVTRWEERFAADAFAPDLDSAPGWRLEQQSPPQAGKGCDYHFCTYVNGSPQSWRDLI